METEVIQSVAVPTRRDSAGALLMARVQFLLSLLSEPSLQPLPA
jgi:hypothetical protein